MAGSIPAWAGETVAPLQARGQARVYPRVGGGNFSRSNSLDDSYGLSPRGRGKPRLMPLSAGARRSIPAWAGETKPICATSALAGVYPRVGGGNPDGRQVFLPTNGLSPRGRGKLVIPSRPYLLIRSIPAWAGETTPTSWSWRTTWVYPRVGGGNRGGAGRYGGRYGLSPRGRGKHVDAGFCPIGAGSIPAWAGETSHYCIGNSSGPVYPRVGGGNDLPARRRLAWGGLSPRGRGKRRIRHPVAAGLWSIPAWAGETFGQCQ